MRIFLRRKIITNAKLNAFRPRCKKAKSCLRSIHPSAHWQIALELEKELSRPQRYAVLAFLPGNRPRLGKRKRKRETELEKVMSRAAGVDHSVDVPRLVAHRIRRRDRHGLPVVFTRDKFETR